ncbi:MAG: outer membrane protein transport protein [Pseudomonadales bacterium]|nr:outer membrane protein transport protein [Pseudomonadales bacterium]
MQRKIIKSALVFCLLLSCNSSYGQLFQNLLIGNAKAISLGNAVTADPPGIDSIHFNPAGLTRLKGRQYEVKLIAGDVSLNGQFQENSQAFKDNNEAKGFFDPLAGKSTSIDKFAIYLPGGGHTALPVLAAPLGGISYNPKGSKFTFANSVYAPMIFGMTRKDDDPGLVYGKEFSITRLTYFSPSVGYELTDTISIGISVGLSYVGLGVNLPFRSPSLLIQELTQMTNQVCGRIGEGEESKYVFEGTGINLCGAELDPFLTVFDVKVGVETMMSPTVNLGGLWDVTDWLTLGIAYQSEANDKLEGPISLGLSENFHPWVVGISQSPLLGDDDLLDAIVKEALDIPDNGIIVRNGIIELTT